MHRQKWITLCTLGHNYLCPCQRVLLLSLLKVQNYMMIYFLLISSVNLVTFSPDCDFQVFVKRNLQIIAQSFYRKKNTIKPGQICDASVVLSFQLPHQARFPLFLLRVYMIFGILLVAFTVKNSCIPRICVISLTIARVAVPVSDAWLGHHA